MFILLEKCHHYVRESGLTEVAEALIGSRGPAEVQISVDFAKLLAAWFVRKDFAGAA
jgi:hypothetical protein